MLIVAVYFLLRIWNIFSDVADAVKILEEKKVVRAHTVNGKLIICL